MKLKPLGYRVIVQALEEEGDHGEWHRPPRHAKEESPRRARSLAVGTAGSTRRPASARRSTSPRATKSFTAKYGGTGLKVDGEDLLVLRESDVLAKVESLGLSKENRTHGSQRTEVRLRGA